MAEHKGGGEYGATHDQDCPACVEADAERKAHADADNPHRPGTKAHAKYAQMRAAGRNACDPRSETYWSM
jgi:hypothetical protein